MKTALVIVHLSTIDSYAWAVGEGKAKQLAGRIIHAIHKHRGPVYIISEILRWACGKRGEVHSSSRRTAPLTQTTWRPGLRPDQFWNGPLRNQITSAVSDVPAIWIDFDEDVGDWKRFLPSLKRRLSRDQVTNVVVGGVWYDPKLATGCATEVYLYLAARMSTKVDKSIVGCETD